MLQQRENIFTSNDGLLLLRYAQPEDVIALSALSAATFLDTYAPYNTTGDMEKYIYEHFRAYVIKKDLDSDKLRYVLAYFSNALAGYCLLERSVTPKEFAGFEAIEISRIYVDKNYKGKKIGGALMDASVKYAIENKFDVIWLGVWQQNKNAIQFYEHCGFKIAGTKSFVLGSDVQDDFIMVKKIK